MKKIGTPTSPDPNSTQAQPKLPWKPNPNPALGPTCLAQLNPTRAQLPSAPRVRPRAASPTPSLSPRCISPRTRAYFLCHAGPTRQRSSLPFLPGSAQRPPGITGEVAGIPIPPQSPALPFLTPAAPLRRHPIPLAPHEP